MRVVGSNPMGVVPLVPLAERPDPVRPSGAVGYRKRVMYRFRMP